MGFRCLDRHQAKGEQIPLGIYLEIQCYDLEDHRSRLDGRYDNNEGWIEALQVLVQPRKEVLYGLH